MLTGPAEQILPSKGEILYAEKMVGLISALLLSRSGGHLSYLDLICLLALILAPTASRQHEKKGRIGCHLCIIPKSPDDLSVASYRC